MSIQRIADTVVNTDVLVVGGGLAGCCAAAKAAEHGLNVTLLEKAVPERSGDAAQGIDHFEGFFPRDGATTLKVVQFEEWKLGRYGARFPNLNLKYKIYENCFWILEELERFGVPMKWDDGDYLWMTFPVPTWTGERVSLRVHWQNVKPRLAEAVKKRKVNVIERSTLVDLLTDNGRVIGATAVNSRTGQFIVIKAKATILGTGRFNRSYDAESSAPWKYKMNYHFFPGSISGDGMAAAYRAGADLVGMDMGGWMFRMHDEKTISYGNFTVNDGIPMHTYSWTGKETLNPNAARYLELEREGLTPLYHNLSHLPDDFQKRMEVAYVDERMVSFPIAEERGFNPRTHFYLMMPIRPTGFYRTCGVNIDEDFQSSLKGLFAIGGTCANMGSVTGACGSGLLVGDNIPKFVNEAPESSIDEDQVENQKRIALAPASEKDGTEYLELEATIRQLNARFAGIEKNEGGLREGLRRLETLQRVFLPRLMARTPHYLVGCLEVRNILELSRIHMQGALLRRETRGNFLRLDCPGLDEKLDNKCLIQRQKNGQIFTEYIDAIGLKPEYSKGGK